MYTNNDIPTFIQAVETTLVSFFIFIVITKRTHNIELNTFTFYLDNSNFEQIVHYHLQIVCIHLVKFHIPHQQ